MIYASSVFLLPFVCYRLRLDLLDIDYSLDCSTEFIARFAIVLPHS